MNLTIHKLTEAFPAVKISRLWKLPHFLLAGLWMLLFPDLVPAQSLNISNTVVNVPAGTYIITDGGITMQNAGAVENSGALQLKGDWTNDANGLINSSPGKVVFDGTSNQTITGTSITSFNDVTINNAAGVTLASDADVEGTLDFANGKITTGSNILTVDISGTVINAASGKYVYGNLEKYISASGNKDFEIGDATVYAPVNLSIYGVGGTGSVTASTLPGAPPDENNPVANSSGINQGAKANRYWNITQSGFTFSSYDAAFNFDAGEATGNPLNYVVRKFDSSWNATTTGTVTSTSTQATGLTSFSEFETGEPFSAVNITCPGDITTCNPVVTFTPSSTSSPAPSLSCSPASGSTFSAGTTSVTCTATNINGTASCSFNVTVQTPSTAATGATSNALYGQICLNSTVTLTANGGSLGTAANWVWYEGGCAAGASIGSGASITITPLTNGAHQYFVRAEGACGPTACQSVTVNVISAPPSNTIHYTAGLSDGCVGAPPATISVNAVANCTFYHWSSANAGVLFDGNPSPFETTTPNVNVTFTSLPATGASGWSICVFGGNACGNTNNICTWVRATVSIPSGITGSIIGCPGSTGNIYSTSVVSGAASYQWTGSAGITVNGNGSQSITVDFSSGFVSGTLSVHGQTACGYNGGNRTITLSRAPALPGGISGTSYPCPNASSAFSVTPVPGAVSYTWTTSVPGAVVTGTGNTCSIAFPASIPGGSTVSVTANSSCPYSGAVRSKGIANGLPGVPANINGPANGQCGQTGVSYSISPVVFATGYSWSATCGTIQGPNFLSGITMDWAGNMTNCTISVISVNACGNSAPRTLLVTGAPNTPTSISGNTSVCNGGVEQYCAVGSNGANAYQWTVPPGAVILGPSNGGCIIVQWGATGGTIICKASNGCGVSGSQLLAVAVTCRGSQVNSNAESFNGSVYPNPATEKSTVKFTAASAGQYHLNMTDVLGQNVLKTDGETTEGINMIELNLNSVAKGMYMLNIISGDNNGQIRMVVE